MFALHRRYVYMSGMHGPSGKGGPPRTDPPPRSDPPPKPPFDPALIEEQGPEGLPVFESQPGLIDSAYAAIIAGDSARYAHLMAEIGGILFDYDVDYADAVMKWFSDFERGVNSIRAAMQGFSSEKGDYKLGPIEVKVFEKAKALLEKAGFVLSDVPGGEIVQRMLDAYNNGQKSISISKQDANKVLQFMAQLEDKIVPSEFKQDVLSAQLESSNKKRSNFFEATMPALLKNLYDR